MSESAATTVAALYVEPNGVYAGLPGVELWDEARDARLYAGPWPVVAHPPCARWSRLAGFTQFRFGLKRGDDGGCFKAALHAVRTYGGVLEHPAYSDAWRAFHLPRPTVREGWTLDLDGGASCYVEQGRYGLPVKKATWREQRSEPIRFSGSALVPSRTKGTSPVSDAASPFSALEQLQARRIAELEAALREYANPQHWGISRDDLDHRVVSWIGPGAEKAGMPDPMQIARGALGDA